MTKTESARSRLPLKASNTRTEETEEVTASLAAANEMNRDAAVAADSSRLDGILAVREEQGTAEKNVILPTVRGAEQLETGWAVTLMPMESLALLLPGSTGN